MKYVLLLTRGTWQEEGPEATRTAVLEEIGAWFAAQRRAGTVIEANQLHPPHTATTVVIGDGTSTLVDRPLLEAKEGIGGYALIEAADLDAALAVARSFPVPDGKVEVRPVVER